MSTPLRAALIATLSAHFSLSNSRLETLAFVILGLVNGRTVNLTHIASQFPGQAKLSSHYRRLQRFFQFVCLDQKVIAKLVIRTLALKAPVTLALDRTNWQLGKSHINILTLAVVTQRFRIPILWSMMNHRGNSDTKRRIELIQHYLDLFGADSIKVLLADREFIGANWLNFLNKNKIPFAIRLKSDMRFTLDTGGTWKFSTLTGRRLSGRRKLVWSGWLSGMENMPGTKLTVAAKRLKKGDWLIIVTNTLKPNEALNLYRRRWAIECLFGDTKTRGLNMEDTHMTTLSKISTLLSIVTLSILWACKCATKVMGNASPQTKSHGRPEKSYFRIGLDSLRKWIIHQPDKAKQTWLKAVPKRKLNA